MVRGRFEQLGRDTPLVAVSEACDALVADLLALDERALAPLRAALRAALGDSAGLLARTIPSLRALLGDVAPTPDVGDQAAAVRSMQAHAALLGALASSARPVVAFLDDLQWADVASLDLIEFLVGSPDLRGILIIGGYRDDEVGPAHPLTRMRARIEALGRPLARIRPGPLDLASATALVADACRCPPEVAAPLAVALRERTGGNPFFLRTLLGQMHERGLLQRQGTGWSWSADAPDRLDFADNVVDAVLERTDVFGLGAMLYAILTARGPFSAATSALSIQLARLGQVKRPELVARWAIAPELSRIVMKALARSQADRYQTVDALADDVRGFLRGGGWFATRSYPPGEVIAAEGEPGDEAFVITDGRCEVSRTTDGVTVALRTLGPGDVFGETAVFTGKPRTATVAAIDRVTVKVVTRTSLDRELDRNPWMGSFVRALAERFREHDERLSQRGS